MILSAGFYRTIIFIPVTEAGWVSAYKFVSAEDAHQVGRINI